MASFPSALATFAGFVASNTLKVDHHGAQHNLEQAEILAAQTKIGTGAATPVAGTVLRGNGVGSSTWDQVALATDVKGVLPTQNGGTGLTSASQLNLQVLAVVYPIGCIYTEITGVNPATTLGFGTWVSFGNGRVLVGNGTSDQGFTAGNTGGESSHTLAVTEIPSHKHWISAATFDDRNFSGQATNTQDFGLWSDANTYSQDDVNSSIGRYSRSDPQNGGGSHNNLQPYIVVYFWQRTA